LRSLRRRAIRCSRSRREASRSTPASWRMSSLS